MRINKYVALASSLSRRAADAAIEAGRVTIDAVPAVKGTEVKLTSQVKLDGKLLSPPQASTTILFHKPIGVVCSRNGQGSRTVFDCLPQALKSLQTVGRLDKDSSGLLLLTNDGLFANQLTHPSFSTAKRYEVTLDKQLQPFHQQMITDYGVQLNDGGSMFSVSRLDTHHASYEVVLYEGRNRQIRRTFAALGYAVVKLHRTNFGPYSVGAIPVGSFEVVSRQK